MISVDFKLARAEEFLGAVKVGLADYLNNEPFRIDVVEDAATEQRQMIVRIQREPAPELSLLIGDFVHNARTALDHLASQLVISDRGTASDDSCFPVTSGEVGWGDRARKCLPGLTAEHRQAVKALKPWRTGNDALWRLHQLDIIDKHRLLLVVLAQYRGIVLGGQSWRPFPDQPEIEMPEIALNAAVQDAVHDGYVAYQEPLEGSPFGLPKIRLDLALGEGTNLLNEPLVPLLDRMLAAAKYAVAHVRSTCGLT